MATEADIFGKLSRIFETHGFSGEDQDSELDALLDELDPLPPDNNEKEPEKNKHGLKKSGGLGSGVIGAGDRPTPYEVWEEKQRKKQFIPRSTPTLNGEQWDRLVDKMHQSNRAKQSAMIREQNQGLAHELGGYLFKPRINKTSQDLSATMKSLQLRLPEMLAEREKELEARRKESKLQEIAECTFTPHRIGAAMSSKYLEKRGRKKFSTDDLLAYEEERKRRIELRKQILSEVEGKELTFRPQLSEKTQKIREKMVQRGAVAVDPITKTALNSPNSKPRSSAAKFKDESNGDARLEEGPMLVIESEHPYRNNTNEFTTVSVPGAVSYSVVFHEDTKTEAVYDYVKFFENESHTEYFGCGKYSGGSAGTPGNWPGTGTRPPLHIPAGKFVIQFKTNGSQNDWGFRIHIVPTLLVNNNRRPETSGLFDNISLNTPMVPNISEQGKNFVHKEQVHQRLYKHALNKRAESENAMAELYQSKLNVSHIYMKPWEITGKLGKNAQSGGNAAEDANAFIKMHSKTHLPKAGTGLAEFVEEMVVSEDIPASAPSQPAAAAADDVIGGLDGQSKSLYSTGRSRSTVNNSLPVTVVEFDDSLGYLWKQLRTT